MHRLKFDSVHKRCVMQALLLQPILFSCTEIQRNLRVSTSVGIQTGVRWVFDNTPAFNVLSASQDLRDNVSPLRRNLTSKSVKGSPLLVVSFFQRWGSVFLGVKTFSETCLCLDSNSFLYSWNLIYFLVFHRQVFLERFERPTQSVDRPRWSYLFVKDLTIEHVSFVLTLRRFATFLIRHVSL